MIEREGGASVMKDGAMKHGDRLRLNRSAFGMVLRNGKEVSIPIHGDVAPSFLFRGSIRGAAASGVLSSFGPYCKSDTVTWTASRVP